MNIKPLSDRLIVQRLMPEQPKTASGILLPATEESQDTPYEGRVLAVGPGKVCALQPAGENLVSAMDGLIVACRNLAEAGHGMAHQSALRSIEDAQEALDQHKTAVSRVPMSVRVGDRVIFSRHGHQFFRLDGIEFVTFSQDSVIGVVSE